MPITPTIAPCTTKMPMMLLGLAPSVRRMAMSARLSVTVITSVLTRLNAATATMSVRMMNIMRFSSCTAANQVRFCCVQSRISSWPLRLLASCCATSRAWCRSFSFSRTPVGPSRRKMRCASSWCSSTRAESYS
ncbi:hypothetical protein D3C72_1945790 [compost metagenome]